MRQEEFCFKMIQKYFSSQDCHEDLRMESPGGGAEGDGQRHRPGRRRGHQLQRVRLADDQVRGEGRPDLDD